MAPARNARSVISAPPRRAAHRAALASPRAPCSRPPHGRFAVPRACSSSSRELDPGGLQRDARSTRGGASVRRRRSESRPNESAPGPRRLKQAGRRHQLRIEPGVAPSAPSPASCPDDALGRRDCAPRTAGCRCGRRASLRGRLGRGDLERRLRRCIDRRIGREQDAERLLRRVQGQREASSSTSSAASSCAARSSLSRLPAPPSRSACAHSRRAPSRSRARGVHFDLALRRDHREVRLRRRERDLPARLVGAEAATRI